jgi:formate-dependent nitrite reductase cytochrome c552 subunit
MKKSDLVFLAVGVLIVLFFWFAPPETTVRIPADDNHSEFSEINHTEGKKAAEKFCRDCHNPDDLPLAEGHPPKYRCLFCHKFSE